MCIYILLNLQGKMGRDTFWVVRTVSLHWLSREAQGDPRPNVSIDFFTNTYTYIYI